MRPPPPPTFSVVHRSCRSCRRRYRRRCRRRLRMVGSRQATRRSFLLSIWMLPRRPSVPETPRSEMRLDQLPRAPLPKPPAKPVTAASDMSAALEPSATTGAVVPAAKSEPKPVDESSIVRSVLNEVRTRLQQPRCRCRELGVARRRPNRARAGVPWTGLATRVAALLRRHRRRALAAYARCSGTATWVPKVGGGARTAARRWDFELRKRDGAWEIERAVAR